MLIALLLPRLMLLRMLYKLFQCQNFAEAAAQHVLRMYLRCRTSDSTVPVRHKVTALPYVHGQYLLPGSYFICLATFEQHLLSLSFINTVHTVVIGYNVGCCLAVVCEATRRFTEPA
jgi:hypothetical protein